MRDKRRVKKIFLTLGILLVVILIAFAIGFKIYTGNYYAADERAIEEIKENVGERVSSHTDDTGTVFLPKGRQVKAVIFFYPGGKVEYTAYSGLMYELADEGYICVIPRMPENLAFLRVDAIDAIRSNYEQEMTAVKDLDWYLAGHSLGGVAAAKYLAEQAAVDDVNAAADAKKAQNSDVGADGESAVGADPAADGASQGSSKIGPFKGLILCASYPADDLSGRGIRFLSIRGSEDGVLNMERYEDSRKFWPSDSCEMVIDGGIHSFFGCYGIQKGDGDPGISNAQQLQTTAQMIDEWISD